MAKNLQIQLEFDTKGHPQLIEALKELAKQQRSVARSQREFNNANIKAVTAHKRLLYAKEKHRSAMMKNQRQIDILNRRLEKLTFANQKLGITTGRVTKAQNRMRLSTAGLQRVIGSIRNKILLVTFAFGGMAAGIRSSVQTAMQFEAVQVRLNSMFGSVQRGEQAFRTFNQVAATTPFTLTDVVEAGAALKAFGTNAEEMIKPTADLAAFMGVTATEAAQALGRAFAGGAGAADILRERGILQLIRDTKGIEDLSTLTLPQFRKALEETLLDPSVGIAGATEKLSKTLTGMVSNMADAFTRMQAAIGEFINMRGIVGTLTGAFEKLGERIRQANETPFETSIRHLQEMGVKTTDLELTQAKLLKTRLEENGATGDLIKAEGDLEAILEMRKESAKKLAKERQKLIDAGMSEEKILKRLDGIAASRAINDKMSRQQKEALNDEEADLLDKLQRSKNLQEELAQRNLRVKELMEALGLETEYAAQLAKILGLEEQIEGKKKLKNKEDDEAIEKQKTLFELIKENFNQIQQVSSLFMDQFGKVLSLQKQNLDRRIDNEIKALKKTEEFQNASMERRQTMEDEIRAKFAKQQKQLFEFQKKFNIAKIIMDTAVQLNKLMGDGIAASIFDPKASFKAKALTAGLLALSAKQIDLVSKQQAPAFARGGSFITQGEQFIKVGDNAGGRERVDITPISTPDFGDAGGGGSINVNIMGNVIGTQEFVRDSLLPEIENTIRRNLA